MEHSPRPLTAAAHWDQPQRMRPGRGLTKRAELRGQMTAVFGTAQPVRGLSGLLRRIAYSIPETRARHWMALLLADRVDVWEHRLVKLAKIAAVVPAGAAAVVIAVRFLKR